MKFLFKKRGYEKELNKLKFQVNGPYDKSDFTKLNNRENKC